MLMETMSRLSDENDFNTKEKPKQEGKKSMNI